MIRLLSNRRTYFPSCISFKEKKKVQMHIKQKCMKSLSLSLPLSSLNNKVIIHLLIIATLLHLYWRVPVFTQVTLTVSLWNVFASISQERKQKHWEIKWMNWITYLRIPGLLLESGTLTPRTYRESQHSAAICARSRLCSTPQSVEMPLKSLTFRLFCYSQAWWVLFHSITFIYGGGGWCAPWHFCEVRG